MGPSTIARYETGETQIDADRLPDIAAKLGCSPCDFFEERAPAARSEPRPSLAQGLAADLLAVAQQVPEGQLQQFLDFLDWQAERKGVGS